MSVRSLAATGTVISMPSNSGIAIPMEMSRGPQALQGLLPLLRSVVGHNGLEDRDIQLLEEPLFGPGTPVRLCRSFPSQGLMESENMRVLMRTSMMGLPSFIKKLSTTHSAPIIPRSDIFEGMKEYWQ